MNWFPPFTAVLPPNSINVAQRDRARSHSSQIERYLLEAALFFGLSIVK
jgi:hypothetical protein